MHYLKRTLRLSLIVLLSTLTVRTVFSNDSLINLSDYQVFQRTTEAYADIALAGRYTFLPRSHVILRVSHQVTDAVVPGFDWIPVDTFIGPTSWKGILRNLPVGGEYKLQFKLLILGSIKGEHVIATVSHILVGDIWGAAGQSNMVGGGNLSTCEAPIDQVHVITLGKQWQRAEEPLGGWGSGPALRFAKKIFSATGIPVGLAFHAHCGTTMYFWEKGAQGFEEWTSVLSNAGGNLKGMIWYQGESNILESEDGVTDYKSLTKAFIMDIRRYVNNATLPWIIAQVATIGEGGGGTDIRAMIIREAQREFSSEDSCDETITTIDLPRVDYYHFDTPQYQTIGDRFAAAALAKAYGRTGQGIGPRFLRAVFENDAHTAIAVTLQNVRGTIIPDSNINGFFLLKNGAPIYPLQTKKTGDRFVHISLAERCSSGVTIGYGYGLNPQNLNCVDSTEIPLEPFYNQPVAVHSDTVQQDTSKDNQKATKISVSPSPDVSVIENPFGLYSIVSIRFPQVKNPSSVLSLYTIGGIPVRSIKLSPGQDRCTLSRKFLPPGCYVLRFKDGTIIKTKTLVWKFARGK